MTFRDVLKNLALCVIVIVVIAAGVEIAFRLILGSPLSTRGQAIGQKAEGELEYRLIANLDREYAGARVITNSLGLRDFRPPRKSTDKQQVLVLGDSFTFGYGLPLEQSYPYQLEQYLNQQPGGTAYEVINAGVPGYDTVDELGLLKRILPEYSPKWIIVGLHPGDFMSRAEIDKKPLIKLREALRYRSAFFGWFYRFYKTKLIRYVPPPKSMLTVNPDGFMDTPEAVRTKDAFKQMHEICVTSGAQLAIIMIVPLVQWDRYPYKSIHEGVAKFCEENSIHFIDPLPDFSQHESSSLWVTRNDSHYNAAANAIAAQALLRFLLGVRRESALEASPNASGS